MTPELFHKRNQLTKTLHTELDAWEASTRGNVNNFDAEANGLWREKIAKIEAELDAVDAQIDIAAKRSKAEQDNAPVFDTRGAVKSGDPEKEYAERFSAALFSGNRLALEKVQLERTNVTTGAANTLSAIPVEWQNRIVSKLEQINIFRNVCPVRSVAGDQKIVVGGALPTAYKVSEAAAITDDTTFSVANVDVLDITYGVYVPVSKQYANDAVGGLNYIVDKAGTALSNLLESEYTSGAGGAGNMPGLLSFGIVNGGDIGTAIADLVADDFIDLAHAVAPQYRVGNVGFMMNDTVAKTARKLKTNGATGDYIWKMPERYSDLREGMPATIYGMPVYINQSMTNAAGDKAIVFGNFDFYEIYDRDGGVNVMIDPYGLSTSLMNRVVVSVRTYGVCTNTSAFAYLTV